MKTFAFVTFGCKVNQYESQALREAMARKGLSEVRPEQGADVVVVNTCTVTEVAAAEAQREVRRLARRFPFSEITVTGCAADSHRAEFLGLPGVRRVVGHDRKAALCDDPRLTPDDTGPSIFDLAISRFDHHTRAFLKVEDGCDLNCSFCIIPKVRGTAVSRPIQGAVDEARRLVDNGFLEIVLTGVHLGSYGKDLERRPMLPDLVERLLRIPGLRRLRLSSIEANEVSEPLLDLMAAEPRFCPHLHLPLQAGDDAVLRAMRRRYNTSQFLATCERVAERVPDPGLTTDVIVGFPGETDAQFENTMALCRRAGFSRIHIFPYSRRRGTDAARLPDLPGRVKKERLHRLEGLAAELTERYARRFLGRTVEVLVEAQGGYTERYLKAHVTGAANTIVRARVDRVEHGEIHGTPA
ncbi:MAG TPA: tRNA (N(6)-L-threonylcarbamoyladenosine(37)-C(2))-methylthiotransferase MtaB [Planctomycetota bacterium]|nr:tRNA (N(6)-L-threonylcarbamoyladenosine(37)-C(2))-methylthiotransferase MtaB [Planctomycetota bacterium]